MGMGDFNIGCCACGGGGVPGCFCTTGGFVQMPASNLTLSWRHRDFAGTTIVTEPPVSLVYLGGTIWRSAWTAFVNSYGVCDQTGAPPFNCCWYRWTFGCAGALSVSFAIDSAGTPGNGGASPTCNNQIGGANLTFVAHSCGGPALMITYTGNVVVMIDGVITP